MEIRRDRYLERLILNSSRRISLLSFMKAEVLPEQVGIAVPGEAWGTDVLVLTDEQKAQLKALADALVH